MYITIIIRGLLSNVQRLDSRLVTGRISNISKNKFLAAIESSLYIYSFVVEAYYVDFVNKCFHPVLILHHICIII